MDQQRQNAQENKMNKEQEVKAIALQLCTLPKKYHIQITKCEDCGNNGVCVKQNTAEKLVNAGYGDVRAAVEDVAERIKKGIFCELADDLTFKMVSRIEAIIEEVLK